MTLEAVLNEAMTLTPCERALLGEAFWRSIRTLKPILLSPPSNTLISSNASGRTTTPANRIRRTGSARS